MRISDLIKMGLRSLSRRKTRTILTVSGVVIGSLSIIIMVSIGKGMNYNFETQVKQMGSLTTININTQGDIYNDKGDYVNSVKQKLDDNLITKIKTLKHVKAVTPVIQMSASLYSGKYQTWAYITAMDREAFEEFDFPKLTHGEYPNDEDNSQIIFGFSQPENFRDPRNWRSEGKPVDFEKNKVLLKFENYQRDTKKKEFSLLIKNYAKMEETRTEFDYNTYMDLKYFKEIYRKYCNTLTLEDRKKAMKQINEYQQIRLNVDNIDNVTDVQDEIQKLGFQSYSMMQYIKPMMEASNNLQMVLLALGAVSMIVSAISIANTMVMSIYERTKEIGIMKVLGCVISDIRKLFLFEAGMIGFIGGLVGVIVGYISSFLINKYGQPLFGSLMSGQYMYDMTNTKFSIIPFYLPFFAMGIAIGVGLISGYFPARRATKISAIEAMKTDG